MSKTHETVVIKYSLSSYFLSFSGARKIIPISIITLCPHSLLIMHYKSKFLSLTQPQKLNIRTVAVPIAVT